MSEANDLLLSLKEMRGNHPEEKVKTKFGDLFFVVTDANHIHVTNRSEREGGVPFKMNRVEWYISAHFYRQPDGVSFALKTEKDRNWWHHLHTQRWEFASGPDMTTKTGEKVRDFLSPIVTNFAKSNTDIMGGAEKSDLERKVKVAEKDIEDLTGQLTKRQKELDALLKQLEEM